MDWTISLIEWIQIAFVICFATVILYITPKIVGAKPFFWDWIQEDMKRSKEAKKQKST